MLAQLATVLALAAVLAMPERQRPCRIVLSVGKSIRGGPDELMAFACRHSQVFLLFDDTGRLVDWYSVDRGLARRERRS